MSRVRNLVDYQSQTADLDGDATRDLNISGTVTAGAVASANVPDVNLTIAPEVLEIQVDAPDAGQDIMWKWTWEQSTLPYARRTITNSAELNVPLYKEGTYVVNNFAAYDIHGSMTQTHSLYLKWIKSAGTDNVVSWATSAGPISDTHPDINGGNATDVQRITVNVPATITPPSLTNPSVSYTVTNTASGSYTFSGSAKGDNPNLGPFYRGGTYTINITATGHPFYFTTDNGTNFSAGTYFGEYTSGVTGSRTDSGTITFTVPAGAPDTLYYQCGNHGVMRGEITIKDLAVETNINGNYVVYFQHTQEGHATPVELRPIPSLVNQMCIVYDAGSGKFVPQDLATYVENTPSFENKIREVAGTAELVVEDGSAVIAKVNVYDDSTYLPLTGNNPGDQAFATDTDILYIWDGTAWQQAGAANSDDLTEGSTNLFFTDARADARIAASDTDALSEGSTNLYYTDARADARAALLVDSAPATLDTLNELAAALGDDPNFATTTANNIATKLPLAGGTMTGNVSFGDNDKAIFGASTNLEIYANSGWSYIDEIGANNLNIRTNGSDIGLYDTANSQYMARFATGGNVRLYFNGDQKLATTVTGVDVTGGINYASGTLNYTGTSVPTGANHQGLYIPSYAIGLGGQWGSLNFPTTSSALTTTAWWMLGRSGGADNEFTLRVRRGGTAGSDQTAYVVTTSDADSAKVVDSHKWYTGASGGTERMRINSLGNVGIGTTSPDNAKLEIAKAGSDIVGDGHIGFAGGSDPLWAIRYGALDFDMRIDRSYAGWQSTPAMSIRRSNGNVGIGTDDPSASLQVGDATDNFEFITVNSSGGYYSGIKLARGAGDWSSLGNNNYGMLVTDGGFEVSKFTSKGNNDTGRAAYLRLDDTQVNVEKPFGLLSAASDPTGIRAGQLYYNSNSQKVKFYTGTTWQDISSNSIVRSNLLLHWDMTDSSSYSGSGSTVYDISGNGYNGSIQGNPTYSSSNNGYMVFDGYGDYITSSFTQPAGARAFGMWVYYSSTSQPNGEGYQLQGIQAGGGYTYQGIVNGGNVYFYTGTGTGGTISYQLSSGQWYYQVLTFNGSTYNVYVNGSLIQSGSASTGTTGNTFSAAAINANHRLYGYGSEWQFYGQNLTAAEVQQNFNAGRGRYGI